MTPSRPWLGRYDDDLPHGITPDTDDALAMYRATVARHPDADAVRYVDTAVTWRGLDELTDAFAAGLLAEGFAAGERVALYLQNVPWFVIGMVGTWKAGGIAVSINPMNREREVTELLSDSGASVLVCLESLHRDVASSVVGSVTTVRTVLTCSELEFQSGDDPRLFPGSARIACAGAVDLAGFLDRYRGRTPPPVSFASDDVAFLTYTSGTTGPPKGAMNTHGNVTFNAHSYCTWCRVGPDDVILGVAPLFHVTGLIAHIALSLCTGAPLVLFHRFEPEAAVEIIERHRPTFTVGSITVFIALMNAPNATERSCESLTRIWSGGAPIPPSTVTSFRERFGCYIHNIYGLTETTSPTHAVPSRADAPVDESSGAISVGVPMFDTDVWILDEDGAELGPGDVGEIVVSGPQVVPGYWNKSEETANALCRDPAHPGRLHTGDVGYRDAEGWFYVVDRMKDQINAGGYKIWPREVEDVLYEHEMVREAAVVGVPDEYRGETVKAFVSLRAGATVTPDELVSFARERMAAYKYPRAVEILDEVPKNAGGKVLRRELRSRG